VKKWYFISPLILQKIIWIPTNIILRFFGRLEIKGLENLKEIKGNAILACNHGSELDPIIPPAALPFWSHFSPMFYTSRENKFYGGSGWRRHFYGGNFFKAWGSYQVVVGLHDYEKSLANQIRIINDGGTMCYFPEGRTTPNGMIQPAKGGVAYLAYITKVPIVPVRLEGMFHLSVKDFFLRKRKLSITFGKPIYITSNDNTISTEECKEWAKFMYIVPLLMYY
jgi:1-acyl-sn-glycerol-3-phosphate acyltransferase